MVLYNACITPDAAPKYLSILQKIVFIMLMNKSQRQLNYFTWDSIYPSTLREQSTVFQQRAKDSDLKVLPLIPAASQAILQTGYFPTSYILRSCPGISQSGSDTKGNISWVQHPLGMCLSLFWENWNSSTSVIDGPDGLILLQYPPQDPRGTQLYAFLKSTKDMWTGWVNFHDPVTCWGKELGLSWILYRPIYLYFQLLEQNTFQSLICNINCYEGLLCKSDTPENVKRDWYVLSQVHRCDYTQRESEYAFEDSCAYSQISECICYALHNAFESHKYYIFPKQ